jgi:hypothetical protein
MEQQLQLAENSGLSSNVVAVRARIEHWRKTRGKRGPMPEELWASAVSLVPEHGLYRISFDLKLSYESLRVRMARAASRSEEPPARRDGFVEVEAAQLVAVAPCSSAVVELSRADGARVVLRLSGSGPVDLVGLAKILWCVGP